MPLRTRTLLVVLALLAVLSGAGPSDRLTWLLEIGPILVALAVLFLSAARFPLTPLLTFLIGVHAAVLALGGAYTYAEVPLGYWLQDLLDLERNPYDRIGHLAQGFIPAILTREILLRRSPLVPGRWCAFLVVCVCLAFSAVYELFEWWAAVALGASAEAFLGTQGDPWDTQWDMCMALIGALIALAVFSRRHTAQLADLLNSPDP